ncbi:riboflavin biosynthesis pyrimidine reductase [Pararhizobium capsulatum DSM 1112]|uniref:Riboflavin biosynthesis pyrimidine reductase n=1 Tax=Pararhizobium capsulatum DSM 1112 TaxID=1121113 RepID=A0ABU0BWI9_9HYPH|nr:RibD family protein [Pararhizobium capsulatum]MDQ0322624.1 riboflavin biosynthesis pyrimidine reductase [Pararhizobium capsulatum DSM 1112]
MTRPYVICHMITSLDGSLHPSRWTKSPDGDIGQWSALYEALHEKFEGDAWLVGRITMAEMSKAKAHPPQGEIAVTRPFHFANRNAGSYAVALDASGKLHFDKSDINGDHVVVLLGRDVPDSHLAELAADGVSYIVSTEPTVDLAAMLEVLGSELGIRRLLLEGGAGINGSFLAVGLVDELSLLLSPAVEGRVDNQSIIENGTEGLRGKMQLSLKSFEQLDHGVLHLRYTVSAR